MSSILSFDEMNRLEMDLRSVPYEDYFGEMLLTQEQVEERTDFARRMEDVVRNTLVLLLTQIQFGVEDSEFAEQYMADAYSRLVEPLATAPILDVSYIPEMTALYIASTLRRPEDPYTFSEDRIRYTSENEANSVFNREDFSLFGERGFGHKEWVTKMDGHERETHAEVNGTVIPIDEYFEVGGSLMLYPKDFSMAPSPEETVNCRCQVRYLR